MKEIKALLKKEIQLEWRSRASINGILLYGVSTVFICYMAFESVRPIVWNALFWIVLLFAAVNGMAKSFLQETEARQKYLYLLSSPSKILIAKLIYNVVLMLLMAFVCLIFFSLFVDNHLLHFWQYSVAVAAGSVSFAAAFTMISAIVSKAGNNTGLMAILGFPIILPLLLLLLRFSEAMMVGRPFSESVDILMGIGLINVILIVISLILFPYIWRD